MKVLITGISSFLGYHVLLSSIPLKHSVTGIFFNTPVSSKDVKCIKLDITDKKSITELININKPDIIVHMAAISEVSVCDKNPQLAYSVNVESSGILADLCKANNIKMIYISTDMIFEGEKEGAYDESCDANPITVYGKTKLEAEKIITQILPDVTIIRPSLMYGAPANNKKGFLYWMKSKAENGENVPLFFDQLRTPVYVQDVCELILMFIEKPIGGVFHAGGPECMTRTEMGNIYFDAMNLPKDMILPLSINDVDVPYKFNRNLCLNSEKIKKTFNFTFTSFSAGIKLS